MKPNVRVLVLDYAYQPIGTISWEKSFTLWCSGKVEIVDKYEDIFVHSAKETFNVPSVVRFFKNIFRKFKKVKFSRQNVYLRDKQQCQYCGKKVTKHNYTLDHVIPKSSPDGRGKLCWENVVLACKPCNTKKANRTPQEAGMPLISGLPYVPKSIAGSIGFFDKEGMPQSWMAYLYYSVPLDEDSL